MKTIEQIKQTPLSERTVQEEYRLAKHEKRQPRCVYCGELLEIRQMRDLNLYCDWNDHAQSYTTDRAEGAAYEPYCVRCEAEDWEFAELVFRPDMQGRISQNFPKLGKK